MNIINFGIIFIVVFFITLLIRKMAFATGIVDDAGGDPLTIHKQPVALLE